LHKFCITRKIAIHDSLTGRKWPYWVRSTYGLSAVVACACMGIIISDQQQSIALDSLVEWASDEALNRGQPRIADASATTT